MTFEMLTIRCDRCGKRETILDAENSPMTWAGLLIQIQDAQAPRQIAGHLCDTCKSAEPFFEPKPSIEIVR